MTPEQAYSHGLNHKCFIRPPWATHRIIYCLYISWGAWPEEPPQVSHAMVPWLDRNGQAIRHPGDKGAGRPEPPKLRTIDLRVGDEVMTLGGRWATITEVLAYRHHWLTAAEAAGGRSEGYIYELPPIGGPLTAPAATEPNG